MSSITIPGGVTSIEDSAFYGCSNLSSITIPNGVTSIGDSAFYDCSKLSSITIPEGVTNIGDCAFIYCRNLSSITIPGGVRIIGDSAFRGCSNLSSITIPEGVTNIGDLAFYYCSNLWSITIPDSVTNIGKSAFESTSYYNSSSNWENDVLYIGNHLIKAKQTLSGEYTVNSNTKTIADSAFSECSNLTAINTYEDCKYYCSADGNLYDKDKKIFVQYAPGKQDNEFVVPEGVTSIKAYAFAGCNNLMNVTIPEGAMSIGAYAFSNCGQLMHITIPEGVTSIGNGAFNYCSNLVSITIPEGVTSIGDGAFSGCSKLNSITIPEGVTSIGDSAFYDCSKLSSITILEGVTSIGNYAFYNCSSLGSIALPEGVTSIGNHAFYNCSSLSSITIPNGVTSIGDSAFSYCGEVYYNGTDEEWKKIEGTGNNEYLHGVSTTYFAYMNLYDKDGKEISKKTQNMDETVDISAISIPDGSTLVLYRDRELTREYPLDTPIRENLTLYADFVELNKLKLSGTDKVGVGQKGVAYNISFSTDKNANSIVTVIKYPESLTLNEIQSEDFDISQDQYSENGYIYLSLECTYKNGNMPKNKNLSLSELLFDVSGKVKPNDSFTIEFLSDETFLADENGTTYDFSDFENVLINVNPVFIESIAINGDDEIDKATRYTAVILPENATDKELEWGVDDAEIATVSTDGVLTPIKSGTVKITATAKDGSGIYGEKTVNVKVYAEILSLESNVGVFDKTFSPSEREYTIYVPKNTASVKLTARHNGTLKMGTKSLYNGRAATVMLSDDETILKLNYKCEGYSDSIYSVKVVKFEGTKTDVSADGKTFNVKTINVDKDSVVILALYDGNKLIETQSKAYNTELTFTTDKAYVNAKVMVWKSIDGMEPVADVEIIK